VARRDLELAGPEGHPAALIGRDFGTCCLLRADLWSALFLFQDDLVKAVTEFVGDVDRLFVRARDDLNGKYLYGWGGPGRQPGQFNGPHSITTDQDGNLYLAEVFNGRVQKFRPKPNADSAKLVGQVLRLPS
jgi:hypothetical protein